MQRKIALLNIIKHYRKLWFFNFNRFKNENYKLMREYFVQILIDEIEEFVPLWGKRVLDVGGAKGEFCRTLNKLRRCEAINLDPYPEGFGRNLPGDIWPQTRKGFADNIPFGDNKFDLVICRAALEHIPKEKQQASLDEIYRVTKRGGIAYIAIPPWYNPFAGHALNPFHYLPFKVARFLARNISRKKITANSLEELRLCPTTFKRAKEMITKSGFKILKIKDVHLRLHFMAKIPLAREIFIPCVAFILIK